QTPLVVSERPHDEVVVPVAVDVASPGDGVGGLVVAGLAIPSRDVGQRGGAAHGGQHDVGGPGVFSGHRAPVGADDEIVVPVAVDVAGTRDAVTGVVARDLPNHHTFGRGERDSARQAARVGRTVTVVVDSVVADL